MVNKSNITQLRELIFPVLHLSILHGFLAREEILCHTGIMSDLSLYVAVTVFVSFYMQLSVLLGLKNAVLLNSTVLALTIFQLPFCCISDLWLKEYHIFIKLSLITQKSLHIVLLLYDLTTMLSTERKAYLIWLNDALIYGILLFHQESFYWAELE